MFRITSNAWSLTGDGVALAYRHGVPMQDMEFYQFHPTGVVGIGILLSEAARGEGGTLLNDAGERFMERYAPTLMELAPRDMVSRAMYQEIRAGRGIGGKDWVYLDVRHLGRQVIEEKLADIAEFARVYQGVEPITEPVPVQPTAHYAMGGIPTDLETHVTRDEHNTIVPGPVCGRGVRLRLGPRRQPARHQLARRSPRLRSPCRDDAWRSRSAGRRCRTWTRMPPMPPAPSWRRSGPPLRARTRRRSSRSWPT